MFKEDTHLNPDSKPFRPKKKEKEETRESQKSELVCGSNSIPSNGEYYLNLTSSSDRRKDSKSTLNFFQDDNTKEKATQVNLAIMRQDVGINSEEIPREPKLMLDPGSTSSK